MVITGVNDTGDKLFTGVNDTGINPCLELSVIAGVVDTQGPGVHWFMKKTRR
jgi:hypothetical protein